MVIFGNPVHVYASVCVVIRLSITFNLSNISDMMTVKNVLLIYFG